jgi:hypothetical protein
MSLLLSPLALAATVVRRKPRRKPTIAIFNYAGSMQMHADWLKKRTWKSPYQIYPEAA